MSVFSNLKKVFICGGLLISFTGYSGTVTLNLSGLEDLGANARYEGWLVVGGSPVSTGVFSVDGMGNLSQSQFNVSDSNADVASAFILSIEPFPDMDPAPAESKILAGYINAGVADVSVGHPAAIGDDFTASTGMFELNNPTGNKGSTYVNGIWYVFSLPPPTSAALSLPTLPVGWVYEGWVVDNDANLPVSTGTFTDVFSPDSDGAGSAAGIGTPFLFPGQDFISPARDLSENHTAVISVEPVPDNSPDPFTLKPLLFPIADVLGSQTMSNNALASNPFGQVSVVISGITPPSVQPVPSLQLWSSVLLSLLAVFVTYRKLSKEVLE